ncbi:MULTISPECIES: GNAT family N-acetyltransferase [Thalassobaculum]|uniref:Predicted N-acetyltransferase YhbS n=1 Tax=Thalassobaculum litoreum DSM 18839 TaxID=1123362 RepID=A0A8G2BIY5_9PROT|nr:MULTISPECIES: GNAT family N-acetyltransferase [Thalassobaculum]SDF62676.1 Predicted N-acetyltransferase YhbS [Thalassobaculum litoreum DSM 18839]
MTASPLHYGTVQPDDLDAVTELVKLLRWPHRREDIDLFMRLGAGHAAKDEAGSLQGVALWWAFEPAAARLGLVMVNPDSQGRGIGRRLVQQVLDDAADRSMMLLATEAGKPLYDKLGFETVGACRQYQGTCEGRPAPDPQIRPATPDDMPAILSLDRTAFGAGRADALQALSEIGRVAVIDPGSGIAGYAIERNFGRGTVVGPIVAGSETDAIRLFRALALPGFVRVDAPVGCDGFARFIEDQGLAAVGADSPVMVRGSWPEPAGQARLFALSSHALG